jgi:uncharacterized protein (TIGR02453 family)
MCEAAGGNMSGRRSVTAVAQASFDAELLTFLRDLGTNNDRDWFAAKKGRYEQHLLEPALAFIEDFAPRLERISPHFRADARRSGGSLFRIYRDTRFSKDKTPYKTHLGIHFRHESAKDVHAPGFYLHIAPGEVFAGGGIWHPDTPTVGKIRDAIVADPESWRQATRTGPFAKKLALGGDTLKRPPAGFDSAHPLIDDLKRKDFFGWARFGERDAIAPGFLDEYEQVCVAAAPLQRFLCAALGLPY